MKYKDLYEKVLNELERVFSGVDVKNIDNIVETIKDKDRIFLIGVGREGLATRAFAMRLMHLGKEVHWVWDDTTPSITDDDLLIATVGDGEIGHLDYICRAGKKEGCKLIIITGSPSGDTVKIADYILHIPAQVYRGKDETVASILPMGSLFEESTFILFDIITMLLIEELNIDTLEIIKRHRNIE